MGRDLVSFVKGGGIVLWFCLTLSLTIHHLIQEELAVLRLKLSELVDENKRLHTELKTTVVHEILRDGSDLVKVGRTFFLAFFLLFFFFFWGGNKNLPDCSKEDCL